MMDTMNKRHQIFKFLATLFAIAGGIFAAGIGAVAALTAHNSKKMKEHEHENNNMEACLFQKEEIELKADTQNAYLVVLFSLAHIIVPRPEKDYMNIDITSFAGKISIDMPNNVTIKCDGERYQGLTKDGSDSAPVINLVINDCASSISIDLV